MRTNARVARQQLSLDAVKAQIAAFESSHPGIGADNYADAFRDENGRLIENDEFFEISSLYGLLDAAQRPV